MNNLFPVSTFSSQLVFDTTHNNEKLSIQTCEYIWDCDNMECCDFILFKICCSTGLPSFYPDLEPKPIPIPIPIPSDPVQPQRENLVFMNV